ncbi:hypothetical protein L5515_007227 [Caenorhabditis briggsae]|uniref:Uncharacterized protein n=1 Tax=Caenorhabditis briggsae TaxID=6238 RepID=A0AAE9JKX0_CAEBR|nr:hypothetical protein L5515_007227 [Caenorhabditis briggsae]
MELQEVDIKTKEDSTVVLNLETKVDSKEDQEDSTKEVSTREDSIRELDSKDNSINKEDKYIGFYDMSIRF